MPSHRYANSDLHQLAITSAKVAKVAVDGEQLQSGRAEAWKTGAIQERLIRTLDESDICMTYFLVQKPQDAQLRKQSKILSGTAKPREKVDNEKELHQVEPSQPNVIDHPYIKFFLIVATHTDLCRFGSPQDPGYVTLRTQLERHFHRFESLWTLKIDSEETVKTKKRKMN